MIDRVTRAKKKVAHSQNSCVPKSIGIHRQRKMSVFADFRRMWMKRFPENSLSSEWEADVRVSLQRHKQKVEDLSKELEQEMLYVEYLERLLSDVEDFRKAGGDLSVPFQLSDNDNKEDDASSVAIIDGPVSAEQSIDKQMEKCDDIGNATNDEHTSASINGVCVTCMKYSL